MKHAVVKAFSHTIPTLLGYIPLGIAFGLMLYHAGYGVIWSLISSVFIYSGTAQFVEVSFLEAATNLLEVAVVVIVLNSRMMFYGLSFIERFGNMGWKKWYMIFSLTDEVYAILTTVEPPDDVDEDNFIFAISFMSQFYWILGGVIGVVAGSLITFDTMGIDFIMTTLFVVLAMGQWKAYKSHEPVFIGLGCSLVSLFIFGPENFIIPALIAIVILLVVRKKSIETKMGNGDVIEGDMVVDRPDDKGGRRDD